MIQPHAVRSRQLAWISVVSRRLETATIAGRRKRRSVGGPGMRTA